MKLHQLLKSTRQYFWDQNFTEVEVSYLQKELPLEPNLYAFQTGDFYLPPSPEFALKEFLSENKKNCFSIAHCFRHLESVGPHHKPEFLMLEYYLINQSLSDLQESLIKYLSLFFPPKADQPLAEKLKFENLVLPSNLPDNEPDFNQFFLNKIEPSLPRDKAVFISGYPAFLSPLAKPSTDGEGSNFLRTLNLHHRFVGSKKFVTEPSSKRFELYINGIEIANGCEENLNVESIKSAFENELNYRTTHHLPLHPFSQKFLKNISHLPPCSGVGIGLDRLLMVINNKKHI